MNPKTIMKANPSAWEHGVKTFRRRLAPRRQPCPGEPKSRNSRTRLSALLSATLITASLLRLCSATAHAQGGVPLWTNRYDGPANLDDHPSAIATDKNGNIFVTGGSRNAEGLP